MIKEETNKFFSTHLNITGKVLYGFTIFFLTIGISNMAKKRGFLFIAFVLVILVIFGTLEKKTQESILPVNFIKSRVFAFSNLAVFVNYSPTYGIGFMLSLYLQKLRGLIPDKAGFIMIVKPLIMTINTLLAGKISYKIESRHLASLGMGLITLWIFLLKRVGLSNLYYVIIQYLILMGFCFSLFSSPNISAVMNSIDKEHYRLALSKNWTMRLLGQTFSMGIIVFIIIIILVNKKIERGM